MAKDSTFPNQFDPILFDKALSSGLTYRVAYRRSYACPCRAPDDDTSPDPQCAVCGGDGYYLEAVPAGSSHTQQFYMGSQTKPARLEEAGASITSLTDEYGNVYPDARVVRGVVEFPTTKPAHGAAFTVVCQAPAQSRLHAQSIMLRRDWVERGEVQNGDMEASIPRNFLSGEQYLPNPAWDASLHDQFTFLDITHRHQQRMKVAQKERLTFERFIEIHSLRLMQAGAVVSKVYGTDFTIQNGKVIWLTAAPPPRTTYILEYTANPVYSVFQDLLRRRHVDGQELPRSVHLRLLETYPSRVRRI